MSKAQIERAQSLKIHFTGHETSNSRPQIELFQFLAEHSCRWQELSIGLTSDLVPHLVGLRNRLPSLRRLWMQWHGPESQEGVESIDCLASAPSLVDVAIFNEYRYVQTLLPAHQLTRYAIDASWEMHQDILTLAPNLVEVHILINFDDGPWPDSGEIIDLSRLQRLFVSHKHILKYLRAPVLQEIALEVHEEEDLNHLLLDPFMLRSGCTLRRLSFSASPTTHTVAEILRNYPSITELAIVHTSDMKANDLISHLTIPNSPGSATMSPQLSEISFGCYGDDSYIDYILLLQMLESRWKTKGCALKSAALLINSGTGPAPATLRGLDVLRREGMELLVLQGRDASKLMDSWVYLPNWA
ncbi:hypothetical protein C8R44DRAFT_728415 [Mycena epipterygia]|nr:hypothetical protein C8R44DRAFT_728415 [Mycena epipterygia]